MAAYFVGISNSTKTADRQRPARELMVSGYFTKLCRWAVFELVTVYLLAGFSYVAASYGLFRNPLTVGASTEAIWKFS